MPAPLPNFTRALLETGNANQLALRAFDALIEQPGARYNPLLVHGPSGVGKTHIAHAIGNAMRQECPQKAIACLTAAAFGDELVAAMQDGTVERWRARYRRADVLILDDVQSLADGERTQEELFHLFNHLYDRGGQIVLTCDRPPREVRGLADRLRSRFEGGLVVTLHAPDRAMRERLVRRWLLEASADPMDALVALLADRDVASVRDLSGQFNRVRASAELDGHALTLESAQRALGVVALRPARLAMPQRNGHTPERGQLDDFFLDREKVIWEWPDIGGRIIEEVR